MEQDLPLKYPADRVVLWHSILSMSAGWLAQLILCTLVAIVFGAYPYIIFAAFYSAIVILVAWLTVFTPIYFFLYKKENYFLKRWRSLWHGALIGFLVSFCLIWSSYIGKEGEDSFSFFLYVFLCVSALATVCGGTAAEVGYRLRMSTLEKLNGGL